MASDRPPPAKDRILSAAIRRFAKASYDHTSLRDIASDADVDVAYVHRSFGSKAMLFQAVLTEIGRDHCIDDISLEDLARHLTKNLFAVCDPGPDDMPDPLLILLHSFTSPTAASAVGRKLEELFTRPIQAKLGDSDGLRAASIMSMLIGLRTMHGFLNLNCVDDMSLQEAARRVERIIDAIIHPKPAPSA